MPGLAILHIRDQISIPPLLPHPQQANSPVAILAPLGPSPGSAAHLRWAKHKSPHAGTYRVGEARHPGPAIPMPRDGNCLFHAIGWWIGIDQRSVREQIATKGEEIWGTLCPWDSGEELRHFLVDGRTEGQYGNALHIAVAAQKWNVQIEVHHHNREPDCFPDQNPGQTWHLLYHDVGGGHYDVFEPSDGDSDIRSQPETVKDAAERPTAHTAGAPQTTGAPCPKHTSQEADSPKRTKRAIKHLGGNLDHTILSLNVGGSRDAIELAFQSNCDVILLQEHRLLGPELEGIQNLGNKYRWHGVWDSAHKTKARGRSGGTAVLVRKPCIIMKGEPLSRGTHAVIAWTRTTRIHLISCYGADSTQVDADTTNARMVEQFQRLLRELGHVPWVIGGDWNWTPDAGRPERCLGTSGLPMPSPKGAHTAARGHT